MHIEQHSGPRHEARVAGTPTTFAAAEQRWRQLLEQLKGGGRGARAARAELQHVLDWIIATPPASIGDVAVKLVAVTDPSLMDMADDAGDGVALRQCFNFVVREYEIPGEPRMRVLLRHWREHDRRFLEAEREGREKDADRAQTRQVSAERKIADLRTASVEGAIVKLMLTGDFPYEPFGGMYINEQLILSTLTDLAVLAASRGEAS